MLRPGLGEPSPQQKWTPSYPVSKRTTTTPVQKNTKTVVYLHKRFKTWIFISGWVPYIMSNCDKQKTKKQKATHPYITIWRSRTHVKTASISHTRNSKTTDNTESWCFEAGQEEDSQHLQAAIFYSLQPGHIIQSRAAESPSSNHSITFRQLTPHTPAGTHSLSTTQALTGIPKREKVDITQNNTNTDPQGRNNQLKAFLNILTTTNQIRSLVQL